MVRSDRAGGRHAAARLPERHTSTNARCPPTELDASKIQLNINYLEIYNDNAYDLLNASSGANARLPKVAAAPSARSDALLPRRASLKLTRPLRRSLCKTGAHHALCTGSARIRRPLKMWLRAWCLWVRKAVCCS